MRSSIIRMYAVFTLAKNSACRRFFQFVKPCTSALDEVKQESGHFRDRSCLHGVDAEIRVPPVPVAGDDAAADAGDQAAAAVESRPLGLCRGGTGAKSVARPRPGRHR